MSRWLLGEHFPAFKAALSERAGLTPDADISCVAAAYFLKLSPPEHRPQDGVRIIDADDDEARFWSDCLCVLEGEVRVAPADPSETRRLLAAVRHLRDGWPEAHALLLRCSPNLCRVEGGAFLSVSNPKVFGTIFLDTVRIREDEELAVTLVHELAHQELFLLNTIDPLVSEEARENLRYASFQARARPPIGRLHSTHALFRMHQFARRIGSSYESPLGRELAEARRTVEAGELTPFARKDLLAVYDDYLRGLGEVSRTVYAVVVDGERRSLLVQDGSLPRFMVSRPGFVPEQAELLCEEAHKAFAMEVRVLRHLASGGGGELVEFEAVDPAGVALTPVEDVVGDPGVQRWQAAMQGARQPWEEPGWMATAQDWVDATLADLGRGRSGPVRVLKAGWPVSTVLEVPLRQGRVFFKASYDKEPWEGSVLGDLAHHRAVPGLLGVDEDRRWMLIEDVGQTGLDHGSLAEWRLAATSMADLQRSGAVRELPDYRPGVLSDRWKQMLRERKGSLSGRNRQKAEEMLGPLQDLAGHLAADPLPNTVHNQDFRGPNVSASGRQIFDWADVVLSHPCFTLQRLIDSAPAPPGVPFWGADLQSDLASFRRGIVEAYLQGWGAEPLDEGMWQSVRVSRRLSPALEVLRWSRELRYLPSERPWTRMVRGAFAAALERFYALDVQSG